jgi:acetoin utilization deacetylase AcuC-like enzyme
MAATRLYVGFSAAEDHAYPNHPERPDRVTSVQEAFAKNSDLSSMAVEVSIPIVDTSACDMRFAAMTAVHGPDYLESLDKACSAISPNAPVALCDEDDPDGPTYATWATFAASVTAAGVAMQVTEQVVRDVTNNSVGFCCCRPPGHHATSNKYLGFCFINSIAATVFFARKVLPLNRVAILDIDVHHGNGTQDIFYEDPAVLFIDIHRDGVWPGSGGIDEVGSNQGEGTTMNVPLPSFSGHSAALRVFDELVAPAVLRFQPQLILVSAGFDAHYKDPLESIQFQSATYHALGAKLTGLANRICGGTKVVAILEGGYSVNAMVEAGISMMRGMVGLRCNCEVREMPFKEPDNNEIDMLIRRVKLKHALD